MPVNGKFYLGRLMDEATGQTTRAPFLYDHNDLTTHAVVVGMTGSGKTGLCITLLEEAALAGIPALMIDPKGDITNALLHFPDLSPADFMPWVDPDQARRAGLSQAAAAEQAASTWRAGLEEWDIPLEQLRALQNAAHFTVFTPGSTSGKPVSILASLKAPGMGWEENRELLREKISAVVTALLGLVGLSDIDPVRSREHILLANIFEHAWSQGKDLDLGELILQTQSPPFQKLGVFDINAFFPDKDRFELAMLLNNILAAPTFQAWIEGEPFDIPSLLFAPDGRPRHSVFYIAHLNDAERMFFVTLLYSAVESWMRTQPGSASLRALLYFDEIFGYLPPVSNPPSKAVMLRMLKQARAFGVGQVLVTQNPVDLDYKALANAGTWFIGKLQTENDKQRLLDGLQSAAGSLEKAQYARLIAGLGKRAFLAHNVHQPQAVPRVFVSRWAMNFLAGPLTRSQIPAVNALAARAAGAASHSVSEEEASTTPLQAAILPAAQPPPPVMPEIPSSSHIPAEAPRAFDARASDARASAARASDARATAARMSDSRASAARAYQATRQPVPSGVSEYFLPNNLSFTQAFNAAGRPFPEEAYSQGLVYQPVLLAQAHVRLLNRKYNLDYEFLRTALVPQLDRRGVVRWEEFTASAVQPASLEEQPAPRAVFASLSGPLADARLLTGLRKDFLDWVFRTGQVTVRANEPLGVYAGPEVSQADFRRQCAEAARQQRDAEIAKVTAGLDRKLDTLRSKLGREERELAEDQSDLSQRKLEEMGTHAENLFGLFSRRRTRVISTSLSKRRMTERAKSEVQESIEAIQEYKAELARLETEKAAALDDIRQRWGEAANQDTQLTVAPFKKDVLIDLFGIAWFPYYLVSVGEDPLELPGYRA